MTRLRFLSVVCAALAACLVAPFVYAQNPIDAGSITADATAGTIGIRVVSDQPELQRLASTAFGAHGAFALGTSATTVVRFAVAGAANVRVTVERGRPAQASFSQDVAGTSLRNALLRAADAAVLHLTKKPGFFAGRLTFISERTGMSEVYVSDLFFGDAMQMTNDRAQCVTPRWAPDGRRILYTSYFANGAPDIYLIDTGTKQRSTFVSVKGTNTGGRFSPDGSQVAVIMSPKGVGDLFVGSAQGRGFRAISRTPTQIEATPSWAPDGSRIVVASDGQATGHPQLYLASLSGSALQRLGTSISGYCAEPDWCHADRNLIAFTAASGRGYQIAVYSFSAGTAKWASKVSGDGIEPSWTNDGRHLVFTQRTAGSQRICILDTQTMRSTEISPTTFGKAYQASFILR